VVEVADRSGEPANRILAHETIDGGSSSTRAAVMIAVATSSTVGRHSVAR